MCSLPPLPTGTPNPTPPPPWPQIVNHDGVPGGGIYNPPEQAYIAAWRANMTYGLDQAANGPLAASAPGNGGFAAACWTHTSFGFSEPSIGGRGYLSALSAWYFKGAATDPVTYKLIATCGGFNCSSGCPA